MLRRANIPDDRIQSATELAHTATDLTDKEVKDLANVVNLIRLKYAGKPNTAKNLEELRDEVLTRLADMDIMAEMDPAPCFYGEPPELEIIGKVATDPIHKYGFDHERKRKEVLEANERGEEYRGQKERHRG